MPATPMQQEVMAATGINWMTVTEDGVEMWMVLACVPHGPEPEPPVLDGFYSRPLDVHHGLSKAYFVCDTRTHRSTRLPDSGRPILHPGNACIASTSRDAYLVADLHPTAGADHAMLLLYSSASGAWSNLELNYPPGGRPWGGHGVVVWPKEIWWVDLSYGFLALDLNVAHRELRFVPLPDGRERPPGTPDLDKTRCVGMNIGELRYVEIDERDGDPIVSMWTLLDEDTGTWSFDCEARFKAIWDDEGYKATKLPREVPTVALIHPEHPGEVAYFFLRSRLFGVHLRKCKVLEWRFFEMMHPPMGYHTSRFVRLWKHVPASR
uniref:DUF1618 domain-containing protein n=1 Tax=Oryza brachyantha TaxID=4533 RepID=J3KY71_ORYBR